MAASRLPEDNQDGLFLQKQAYTIPQFCRAFGISRAFLYKLWEQDEGPPRFNIGNRVLIGSQAAKKWLRQLELKG